MDCLKCGVAEEFVKNGFARGKQRYKCKACGYQMTRLAPRGHPMKEKHLALVLYLSGLSMNMIAKIIGVSCQSVMVWIKKFAISVIPHFQRQSKDIIEFAKELQVDEMYHFVQKKLRSCGFGKSFPLRMAH